MLRPREDMQTKKQTRAGGQGSPHHKGHQVHRHERKRRSGSKKETERKGREKKENRKAKKRTHPQTANYQLCRLEKKDKVKRGGGGAQRHKKRRKVAVHLGQENSKSTSKH